jgi:hypothetical protein
MDEQPSTQPRTPATAPPATPMDIDACRIEDREAAARLLADEVEQRLLVLAPEGTQPTGRARATLNVLSLMSLAMTHPPTFVVPPGWPATFPVHPDAHLSISEQQADGTLYVTWGITTADDPAAVVAFYEDHLQQGLPGRWDFASAQLEQTQDGDQPTYANSYQITGEGHHGTVTIDGPSQNGDIHVRAELLADR